jgi:hypothetical protein
VSIPGYTVNQSVEQVVIVQVQEVLLVSIPGYIVDQPVEQVILVQEEVLGVSTIYTWLRSPPACGAGSRCVSRRETRGHSHRSETLPGLLGTGWRCQQRSPHPELPYCSCIPAPHGHMINPLRYITDEIYNVHPWASDSASNLVLLNVLDGKRTTVCTSSPPFFV